MKSLGIYILMHGIFALLCNNLFKLVMATKVYLRNSRAIKIVGVKFNAKSLIVINWVLITFFSIVIYLFIIYLYLIATIVSTDLLLYNYNYYKLLYLNFIFFILLGIALGLLTPLDDNIKEVRMRVLSSRSMYGMDVSMIWKSNGVTFGYIFDKLSYYFGIILLICGLIIFLKT